MSLPLHRLKTKGMKRIHYLIALIVLAQACASVKNQDDYVSLQEMMNTVDSINKLNPNHFSIKRHWKYLASHPMKRSEWQSGIDSVLELFDFFNSILPTTTYFKIDSQKVGDTTYYSATTGFNIDLPDRLVSKRERTAEEDSIRKYWSIKEGQNRSSIEMDYYHTFYIDYNKESDMATDSTYLKVHRCFVEEWVTPYQYERMLVEPYNTNYTATDSSSSWKFSGCFDYQNQTYQFETGWEAETGELQLCFPVGLNKTTLEEGTYTDNPR